MENFNILPDTYILSPLVCFSKKRLFAEIGRMGAEVTGLDEDFLIQALNVREAAGVTDCAKGVGMPHAVIKGLDKSIAILAILPHPIAYHAVDTDYVGVDLALTFFFSSKESYEHIEEVLRLTTEYLDNPDFANSLRRSRQSQEKLIEILALLDEFLSEKIAPKSTKEDGGEGIASTIRQFITGGGSASKNADAAAKSS